MRSNVCKIENGTRDLEAIFKECERVGQYNELTHKQALQLRLLCEELDGMLPNLIDDFEGELYIECEDKCCKVNASIKIPDFNAAKKDELINISKSKKNAAAVGIVGRIRAAIEDFFLGEEIGDGFCVSPGMFCLSTGYSDGVDYSYLWTLEQYRGLMEGKKEAEAWDELEKSVIASVADDVIVGIKGKRADIVIVKNFA